MREELRSIDVKWVYKTKMNPDGLVSKYKERLVARGFLKKHGIYYNEVFSHVARLETIRLVMTIVSSRD